MIICKNPHPDPDYPDDWIIVKQSDHDDHAGFIAAHWPWDRYWRPWDARLLTIAVAMHDTGSACWEDYPLLFEVMDILSTQFSACGLGEREMTYVPDANGQPFTLSLKRAGEWAFKVDPFPFTGGRFGCPCVARRLPERVYRDDNDFREAWYAAPPVVLPYACMR